MILPWNKKKEKSLGEEVEQQRHDVDSLMDRLPDEYLDDKMLQRFATVTGILRAIEDEVRLLEAQDKKVMGDMLNLETDYTLAMEGRTD